MTEISKEMREYLDNSLQEKFCSKISNVIQIARMHTGVRLGFLERWDAQEKDRFQEWFGTSDDLAHFRISACMGQILRIFDKLKCSDFLPFTTAVAKTLGCAIVNKTGVVAAVCQIPGIHKIMLSHQFFELRQMSYGQDSQVSTLIHEIAHLPDVLGTRSTGEIYSFYKAKMLAKYSSVDALNNSDNIAAYILVNE